MTAVPTEQTKSAGFKRAFMVLMRYMVARGQEASTWRGVIGVLAGMGGLGFLLDPEVALAIISAGVSVAGLIGALLPDNKPQG